MNIRIIAQACEERFDLKDSALGTLRRQNTHFENYIKEKELRTKFKIKKTGKKAKTDRPNEESQTEVCKALSALYREKWKKVFVIGFEYFCLFFSNYREIQRSRV